MPKTYPIVLLQHELITLKLSAHAKDLPFEVVHLLRSLVAVLHHLLLHLLLYELLLGHTLALGLLRLPLLELTALLLFHLPPEAFLVLTRSHQSSLLLLILFEHTLLLPYFCRVRLRGCRGW